LGTVGGAIMHPAVPLSAGAYFATSCAPAVRLTAAEALLSDWSGTVTSYTERGCSLWNHKEDGAHWGVLLPR
jgi:hypothetical protein